MARKNVRVDIPVGNVDRTAKLGGRIVARHTALGAASPLNGEVDMAAFSDLVDDILAQRDPATADSRQKEAWNEQALMVIGIGKGQNLQVKNTVYWHINQVQKFMGVKFRGNEEQASLWGFNVVVGQTKGRRHVSYNVPRRSPEGMLDLGAAMISKHTTDGVDTVLKPSLFDMTDFAAKVNLARSLRDDALAKDEASQAANQLARNLCGYGEGQTSETPGTLYHMITLVRDLLLIPYDGNEEQLSTFGFNVVVSTSSSPTNGGGNGGGGSTEVNISGRITESGTGIPLEGAEVRIYSTASGPGDDDPTTLTDANGNYVFNFPSVEDTMSATIRASLSSHLDNTIDLEVDPGTDYPDQDIELDPEP